MARGEAIAVSTDRLYSSLYLAENTELGSIIYLRDSGIKVIDLPSFSLVGKIGKGTTWEGLAVSHDHAVLFALDQDSQQVSAFDTGDLSLHRKFNDVGHQPLALFPLKAEHLRQSSRPGATNTAVPTPMGPTQTANATTAIVRMTVDAFNREFSKNMPVRTPSWQSLTATATFVPDTTPAAIGKFQKVPTEPRRGPP